MAQWLCLELALLFSFEPLTQGKYDLPQALQFGSFDLVHYMIRNQGRYRPNKNAALALGSQDEVAL